MVAAPKLKSWLVRKAAESMFSKLWDYMQGKKAYIGGIATMLTGLGEIGLSYYNNQGFSSDGWKTVLAGWALIAAKSALTKKNPEPLTVPPEKQKETK